MNFRLLVLCSFLITFYSRVSAQTYEDSTINSSTKKVLFSDPNSFAIGSYGEAHYNQEFNPGTREKGAVDLHRVILFLGYKFNSKLQFFSEIEFEHTNELAIEQAYLNYGVNSAFNIKAGVILIPMGFVNEFHEPTLFNGVERPFVDTYVIPSTWREMGAGFHGIFKKANIKYQAYVVNGFKGYDGNAKFSGASGLRSARQNAAKAIVGSPSLTGKLSYYGINGLKLEASGYYGNSESTLHDGIATDNTAAIQRADSTVVGIGMVGANATYTLKGLQLIGLVNYTTISNTEAYNSFSGANLGSSILGWYGEVSYQWKLKKNNDYPRLIPFVRYENYNTHNTVSTGTVKNDSFNRRVLTQGIGYQITPGTIFKIDYQILDYFATQFDGSRGFVHDRNILNVGFGYWF